MLQFENRPPTRSFFVDRTLCKTAAIASCRYNLKLLEESKADFESIFDVFKAHNIPCLFILLHRCAVMPLLYLHVRTRLAN